MADTPFNILVLCTGNSARSIMSEAVINHLAKGAIKAFSAGSRPTGIVHPLALKALEMSNISSLGLRSKSWDEFATADAPKIDLVITVCDNAANEMCPIWPNAPLTIHWGLPDPVMIDASQTQMSAAFEGTISRLSKMVKDMLKLSLTTLPKDELKKSLNAIGAAHGAHTKG